MFAWVLMGWSAPALADAEVLFRVPGPQVVLVDGVQLPLAGRSRLRAEGLEPGWHRVEIRGLFGRTLYEGEIDVDDHTLTHAAWTVGELRISHIESTVDGDPELMPEPTPESADEERAEPLGEDQVVDLEDGAQVVVVAKSGRLSLWLDDGVFVVRPPPGVDVVLERDILSNNSPTTEPALDVDGGGESALEVQTGRTLAIPHRP